jgi:hypothetical protein
MSTTTFETAKIGNKVFSHTFGWGEIECIDLRSFFPIEVRFHESGVYETYTLEGYCYDDLPIQSLFWDKAEIKAPTKPADIKIINGIEIPDITFKPDLNVHYYTPMPTHPSLHHLMNYCSNEINNHLRNSDLCYPFTEEGKQAAILHAKAMLGITTV